MAKLLASLVMAVIYLCLTPVAMFAQDGASNSNGLTKVIEQAKKDGVRVVIVEPGSQPKAAPSSPPLWFRMQGITRDVKAKFLKTLTSIPQYWNLSVEALRRGGGERPRDVSEVTAATLLKLFD